MYSDIKIIFSKIIDKIKITNNLYKLIKNHTGKYVQYDFLNLYFNTISEIWIINLIYLYKIYNEDSNDMPKQILDEDYVKKINTLQFVMPKIDRKQQEWQNYDTRKFSEKKMFLIMCSEFILASIYFLVLFLVNYFLYKLIVNYINNIQYLNKLKSIVVLLSSKNN